jgi:hypothetical protein
LNQAGFRFFDRRMVSDCVDTPIAGSEKQAEKPAGEADDDRAEEGAPETIDLKSG